MRENEPQYNTGEPEQFRKLFVGGLNYKTSDEGLREYYSRWGDLTDSVVMKDGQTGKSRGFGFVTFKSCDMVDQAMRHRPHEIDGRTVQPKRAVAREDTTQAGSNLSVKKIYVAGIKGKPIEKEDLEEYFNTFGAVKDCQVMMDEETGKNKGFAFIVFDDHDSVDKVVLQKYHMIYGAHLQVKKAFTKETRGQKSACKGPRLNPRPGFNGGGGGGFGPHRGGGGGGGFNHHNNFNNSNDGDGHFRGGGDNNNGHFNNHHGGGSGGENSGHNFKRDNFGPNYDNAGGGGNFNNGPMRDGSYGGRGDGDQYGGRDDNGQYGRDDGPFDRNGGRYERDARDGGGQYGRNTDQYDRGGDGGGQYGRDTDSYGHGGDRGVSPTEATSRSDRESLGGGGGRRGSRDDEFERYGADQDMRDVKHENDDDRRHSRGGGGGGGDWGPGGPQQGYNEGVRSSDDFGVDKKVFNSDENEQRSSPQQQLKQSPPP